MIAAGCSNDEVGERLGHLATYGEGACGHAALEAGREPAPADSGRVPGAHGRGPALGKPRRCCIGGRGSDGRAPAARPLPSAGALSFAMTAPVVASPVNEMADLPKPPFRRRRILERPRLIRALDRSQSTRADARGTARVRQDDARRAVGGAGPPGCVDPGAAFVCRCCGAGAPDGGGRRGDPARVRPEAAASG